MNDGDVKALVTLAQAGDEDALEKLLKMYSGLVKTEAFSFYVMCADRDNDDLLQEGMIGLWKAVRNFDTEDGGASFGTYARRCVRNAIIDELRKAPEPSLPIDPGTEAPEPAQLIPDYLEDAIERELSAIERRVLKLWLDGRSYAEIAAELGTTKKQVDNRILSAKRKLKEALSGGKNA